MRQRNVIEGSRPHARPISSDNAELRDIGVDTIDRNPDNPRIFFRAEELDELIRSIKRFGVQVPISVYKDRSRYVLIDGERRWRCSLKLNNPTIPALVQPKPDVLTNLLLMFNIHSLREQWDLLTIAVKLPRVIELLGKRLGRRPTETELSEDTSLPRSVLRRCRLLMELPDEYRDQILSELKRPKAQQRLTEDFFIEMERALTTVERAMPEAVAKPKNEIRDILIAKYRSGVVKNRVDFRYLSKIARAENVEADRAKAQDVLKRVFSQNSYSIEAAYRDSVSDAYVERDLLTRLRSISERLSALSPDELDDDLRGMLRELFQRIRVLLADSR